MYSQIGQLLTYATTCPIKANFKQKSITKRQAQQSCVMMSDEQETQHDLQKGTKYTSRRHLNIVDKSGRLKETLNSLLNTE